MANEIEKPAVLTTAVQAEIIRHIRNGNYFSTACAAAGTTTQAVEYWKKLFEAGVEHAQAYADFFGALKRASALAETDALENIKTGVDNWQSRAWFLERRFRNRWAQKSNPPDDSGSNGVQPQRVSAVLGALAELARMGGTPKAPGEVEPGGVRDPGERGDGGREVEASTPSSEDQ